MTADPFELHRYNIDIMVSRSDELLEILRSLKLPKTRRIALETSLAKFVAYVDKSVEIAIEEKDAHTKAAMSSSVSSEMKIIGSEIQENMDKLRLSKKNKALVEEKVGLLLNSVKVTVDDALLRNNL